MKLDFENYTNSYGKKKVPFLGKKAGRAMMHDDV